MEASEKKKAKWLRVNKRGATWEEIKIIDLTYTFEVTLVSTTSSYIVTYNIN